jgi:hypothetical protein
MFSIPILELDCYELIEPPPAHIPFILLTFLPGIVILIDSLDGFVNGITEIFTNDSRLRFSGLAWPSTNFLLTESDKIRVRSEKEEALVSALLRRVLLLLVVVIANALLENPTQFFFISLDAIQVKVMRIFLVCMHIQ